MQNIIDGNIAKIENNLKKTTKIFDLETTKILGPLECQAKFPWELINLLKQHKLIGSMSRKGNCWDNAIAENFFGIIKKEYIYQTKFVTRNQAMLGIFDYIEGWYNTQRIHSKLGYLTPNEFEEKYVNLAIGEIKKITKYVEIEVKMAQL